MRVKDRGSAALSGFFDLALSEAQADWTITTYKQIPGNTTEITTMVIADQYFTGGLPTRFEKARLAVAANRASM